MYDNTIVIQIIINNKLVHWSVHQFFIDYISCIIYNISSIICRRNYFMIRFTVKDIAIIASLSAIVVLSSAIYMVYFMLIVLALSLKRSHMYLIALISAILYWWLFFTADVLLINIVFWPLLVFVIHLSFRWIFVLEISIRQKC